MKKSLCLLLATSFILLSCATFPFSIDKKSWSNDSAGRTIFQSSDESQFDYRYLFPVDTKNSDDKPEKIVEFQIEKRSGSPSAGYGFIFSFKNINNYVRVLITANGQYKISHCINGNLIDVTPWATSVGLIPGLDRVARITLEQISEKSVQILFNRVRGVTFSLDQPLSGPFGYYAYVGKSAEERGIKNVQILFKQLSPETVNKSYYLEKLDELAPSIGQYPPRFNSKETKEEITKQYQQLKSELDKLLVENQIDQQYLLIRGRLQSMGHNFDFPGAWKAAVSDFEKVIALNPYQFEARALLGNHIVFTNRIYAEKAAELFSSAQNLYGDYSYQYAQRGLFYSLLHQDRFEDALKQVDILMKNWPANGYDKFRDIVETQRKKKIENPSSKTENL